MSLHTRSVADLAAGLAAKEYSAVELAEYFLARIANSNPALNAFVTVTPERALADARRADATRAAGKAGPLTGIPLAHKDIFCTDGIKTACGSRMLDNFIAPYDATRKYVGVPYSDRFRYPKFFSADARVSKDVKVNEKYSLRFSLSVLNMTNHFNALDVHANTGDPQYGVFFGNYKRLFRGDFDVLF